MEGSQLFDFLPRNSSSTGRLMVIVDEDDEDLGCPSPPSSSESSGDDGSACSDITDDATSSSASMASYHSSSSGGGGGSPLYEMSELIEDLPVKRGLSRHFNGKSQSFTSLANARCLQDLVKPMRKPAASSKPMRSCRSYATGLDSANSHYHNHQQHANPHSPRGCIAKKPVRNTSFHASRPPMHPHSSGNLAGQALLFA